jgi:hypothetical protein
MYILATDMLCVEDDSLLGYSAVQSRRSRQTLQRCVLPLEHRYSYTRLDGAISQKGLNFILASVRT